MIWLLGPLSSCFVIKKDFVFCCWKPLSNCVWTKRWLYCWEALSNCLIIAIYLFDCLVIWWSLSFRQNVKAKPNIDWFDLCGGVRCLTCFIFDVTLLIITLVSSNFSSDLVGVSWACSHGSLIYNYLCNQCLSPPWYWHLQTSLKIFRGVVDLIVW